MSGGRPTKYSAEYEKQAEKLCRLGATIADLAEFFEVAQSTIKLWAVQHVGFSAALKIGKEHADDKVEHSLYHRALGYSHPEDVVKVVDGQIEIVRVMKHYPPDTTACIYWTKNRRPEKWRQNTEGQSGGGDLSEAVTKLIDKLPN